MSNQQIPDQQPNISSNNLEATIQRVSDKFPVLGEIKADTYGRHRLPVVVDSAAFDQDSNTDTVIAALFANDDPTEAARSSLLSGAMLITQNREEVIRYLARRQKERAIYAETRPIQGIPHVELTAYEERKGQVPTIFLIGSELLKELSNHPYFNPYSNYRISSEELTHERRNELRVIIGTVISKFIEGNVVNDSALVEIALLSMLQFKPDAIATYIHLSHRSQSYKDCKTGKLGDEATLFINRTPIKTIIANLTGNTDNFTKSRLARNNKLMSLIPKEYFQDNSPWQNMFFAIAKKAENFLNNNTGILAKTTREYLILKGISKIVYDRRNFIRLASGRDIVAAEFTRSGWFREKYPDDESQRAFRDRVQIANRDPELQEVLSKYNGTTSNRIVAIDRRNDFSQVEHISTELPL